MKKVSSIKCLGTFEYKNGFLIDIFKSGEKLEGYLYHESMGIKELMFGHDIDLDNFLIIIERNIDSYIQQYQKEYM